MTKRNFIFSKSEQKKSNEEFHSDDVTLNRSHVETDALQGSLKQHGVPVDTGWAWVVLFAAWCNCLLSNGIYRAFGVMFIEIQARYGSNSSVTSLIVSAINGSYSISALIVTTVGLRYFSNRQFIVLGGIIITSAYCLSSLAPTVEILILLLGCMCGIAQGMIHAPTIALISEYFEKYRSIANCIANMGSSVGALIFSVLIPFWIEEYAFSGTVILLGGLMLQITISGLLMRPVTFYTKHRLQQHKSKNEHGQEKITEINTQKINDPLKHTNNIRKALPITETKNDDNDKVQNGHNTIRSNSPLIEKRLLPSLTQDTVKRIHSPSEHRKAGLSHRVGSAILALNNSNIGLYASSDFTFSSMLNLNDHLGKDTKESKTSCACLSSKYCSFIDCKPMKRIPFLLFIPCACFIVNVGSIAIYLPAFAKDLGFSSKECGILITIISITDVCTVVFWGIFADRNYIKRYKMLSFIVVTVGVTTSFTPLFNSHTIFIVYSVIFGIFGRVYFSLFPVVLVDFIGLENLRSAFGILGLIQAGTVAILQAVIGLMRDHFKTYIPAMLLMSSLVIAGGLLILALPLAEKCEKRKQTIEIEEIQLDES